jgi:hypothetical protein
MKQTSHSRAHRQQFTSLAQPLRECPPAPRSTGVLTGNKAGRGRRNTLQASTPATANATTHPAAPARDFHSHTPGRSPLNAHSDNVANCLARKGFQRHCRCEAGNLNSGRPTGPTTLAHGAATLQPGRQLGALPDGPFGIELDGNGRPADHMWLNTPVAQGVLEVAWARNVVICN